MTSQPLVPDPVWDVKTIMELLTATAKQLAHFWCVACTPMDGTVVIPVQIGSGDNYLEATRLSKLGKQIEQETKRLLPNRTAKLNLCCHHA
jgi:hypothetical protein